MQKIVGYADRLSAAPGETVRFMVSTETPRPYAARLVRVINGDANPAGPGLKLEHRPSGIEGRYDGRPQAIAAGSHMRVAHDPRQTPTRGLTVAAMLWPTLLDVSPDVRRQAVIGQWSEAEKKGWLLEIDEAGRLRFKVGDGTRVRSVTAPSVLTERRWVLAAGIHDPATGRITVVQRALDPYVAAQGPDLATADGAGPIAPAAVDLLVAARPGGDNDGAADHYDGKIDAPVLLDTALDPRALDGLFRRPLAPATAAHVVARWDFSIDIPGLTGHDSGPHQMHGALHNLPARAMKGWNWTGECHDWTRKPEHYGAIHFHADDIYDAGWESDFSWTVPDDWPSGAYACHLAVGDAEDGSEEDLVPVFVYGARKPPAGRERPKVAFLVPTAAYMAYANDHNHLLDGAAEMVVNRLLTMTASDLFIQQHPEYGLSLYDSHRDGSGVCYSSYLRPVLNMRPRYAGWLGAYGSGLWQYNADTHLLDWLEAQDIAFDVVTDEDLHRDGVAALEPYRVVLSGTHPEYHSKQMWDAMMAWQSRGGRLMYLGANGWYWRIAFHRDLPAVIEVRRAEDGIRCWAAEPGEYYHSFTGEYGGLWRRQDLPPNVVTGVGFTAQGFDWCSYYRRTAEADDPRVAFMFDGVEGELIGNFGLIGNGAAGLELDRADHKLGTPPHALVVAQSEGHSDIYLVVTEEVNVTTPDITGSQSPLCRADLTFYETPSGGAVFSTGSIAWCGSLSHNGYDNTVSRLTGNVLRRFLDETPFTMPS
ncbi:MAG: N,N-dimethylformamidase beta subunit family domain-containing protein [Alphaproteobacteria bacterium]